MTGGCSYQVLKCVIIQWKSVVCPKKNANCTVLAKCIVIAGRQAPLKPWERAGTQTSRSGPSPFAPPSNAPSTAATVASAGTTDTGKVDENGNANQTGPVAGRQMPPRPWEQNTSGQFSFRAMCTCSLSVIRSYQVILSTSST